MVFDPRKSAAVIVALLLAACGGGGAAPTGTQTGSPAAPPAATSPAAPTEARTTSPEEESPEATASPTEGEGGEDTSVRVVDFAYDPAEVSVAVGTEISWTNSGNAPHTVTFEEGGPDSGRMDKGDDFSHTFEEAGTFSYFCEFHPDMQATVTVTE